MILHANMDNVSSGGKLAIEIARALKLPVHALSEPATGVPVPDDVRALYTAEKWLDHEWHMFVMPALYRATDVQFPVIGASNIIFTNWCSTKLPESAVYWLNMFTHVVVPNDWVATVFHASGVCRPIHILPLGIDTNLFRPRAFPPMRPFIFGTAGSGARKGITDVIAAFQELTQDGIRLRIKVRPCDPMPLIDDPRIDVVHMNMPDQQLADWFQSIHVFVSASRGEGWGLLQHQAMATGRPLIACRFAGLKEFFHPGTGLEVDYRLGMANEANGPGWWADPNFDDMALQMSSLFYHTNLKDIGLRAAVAAHQWSWSGFSSRLTYTLEQIGAL